MNWLSELCRLQPLEPDLALLPVGWGAECKGPMLNAWQEHAGYSIPELIATPGIRSVGARTGLLTGPLLAFDFDGATSIDLAYQLGLEPWAVNTWHVHRTTDPHRIKTIFRPTPEQIAQLPQGAAGTPEFQGKTLTAPKNDTSKGEALEVFFHGGRQVILLGQHPSSNGHYFWPDGLGPEALSPPPDSWWLHALRIAENCQQRINTGSKCSSSRNGTHRLDPCPICGRHSGANGSALWCEQTTDGLILCMPGSTYSAEQSHGPLVIGQVVARYALVKRTPIPEGDVLTFKQHNGGCKPPSRPLRPTRCYSRPSRIAGGVRQ